MLSAPTPPVPSIVVVSLVTLAMVQPHHAQTSTNAWDPTTAREPTSFATTPAVRIPVVVQTEGATLGMVRLVRLVPISMSVL
jgi:hypothetical protein